MTLMRVGQPPYWPFMEKIMQELTLEQADKVGGGISGALAFVAFWAVSQIGAYFGWWESIP